ncbi:uncharacterized protein LOC117339935 [Pecten maximus]|uniref:uncharacterized protein LOC117339935 n=1 Tax=Pecten maximus TaxID=6579 RepID=UPI001458B21C|nr:uncharacterized protein LOC117339935 [Pecten maximus]
MSLYFGTMYDIAQAVVIVVLYLVAIFVVISAIRERCKNRRLIIALVVIGISMQTIYVITPYWTGINTHNYNKGGVSTDDLGESANTNDLILTKDTSRKQDTRLYGNVIVYMTSEEEFAQTKYSNGDTKLLQMNNKNDVGTTKARLLRYKNLRCADLRLLSLVHCSLVFTSLLLAAVRQNVPDNRQTMVRCVVLVYGAILTVIIAILYAFRTSNNTDILSFGPLAINFQLVVCSQDALEQFLPIFLETVCLFGPCVGMLLVALYRKTGHNQGKADRRFNVFQECRAEHEEDCMACSGMNDILATILVFIVVVLFTARSIHYIYTYVTHGQFYDIWIIACVMVICSTISLNNVFNMFSPKLNSKDSIVIEEKSSLRETKNNIL